MEYIVFAVILYFILQTASNLVLILRGKGARSVSQEAPSPQHGWEGPSPRQQTTVDWADPTFWGEDIEDVRWRDLEGEGA